MKAVRRKRRAPKARAPDAEVVVQDDAPESFRDLVDAFEGESDEDDPPTITDLITAGIAQANRESRHADSAALHLLSLRLGDLRPALAGAQDVADGQLGDALAVLDALV